MTSPDREEASILSIDVPTPDVASFHLLSSPYLKNEISSRKNYPVLLFCFNQKYSVSSSFPSLFSSAPQVVSFSSVGIRAFVIQRFKVWRHDEERVHLKSSSLRED